MTAFLKLVFIPNILISYGIKSYHADLRGKI